MRIWLGLLAVLMIGCTSEEKTIHTLRSAGFSYIKTEGYAWFACSDDDTFATQFSALNPQGELVEGAVCCGLVFKNCTIRF